MEAFIKPIKCKNGKISNALVINGVIVTFDVVLISRILDVPISDIYKIKEVLPIC